MKPLLIIPVLAVLLCAVLASCDPEPTPESAIDQYLDLPKLYGGHDATVALGRVLFYDPKLSANNTISCASCHKQAYAFGDNVALSAGFKGEPTIRNTLPLVDARQHAMLTGIPHAGGLFWDGRQSNMTEAVAEPITNHIEMGMKNLDELRAKLEGVPYYPELFNKAFGYGQVTPDGIRYALASFVATMQSQSSRFDRSVSRKENLTASEELGRTLFVDKYDCASCHLGVLGDKTPHSYNFSAEFANIGLPSNGDQGLALTTQVAADAGRFRVPSLNNVGLTAPYMHDGSIATLEGVIEHYSKSIQPHPNLDDQLREADGSPKRFVITRGETRAIVDFLLTLTDTDVATNKGFSDPFKKSNQ